MKLLNIFKKENKQVASSKIQKLEKNQLEKVAGGAGTSTVGHEAEHVKQQASK